MLNDLMLPDTRIFASLLSKEFNGNKNSIPNLTFPENITKTPSTPLNELTYKTLMIGNSEHIILDNPNNLSDFRGNFEKLKNVALALANKLNKPVSVPAFLLIDDEDALENVRETLSQKNINPIMIETTNTFYSASDAENVNSNNDQTQNQKSAKTTITTTNAPQPTSPPSTTASKAQAVAPTTVTNVKKRQSKPKNTTVTADDPSAPPPSKKRSYNFLTDHRTTKKTIHQIKQEQMLQQATLQQIQPMPPQQIQQQPLNQQKQQAHSNSNEANHMCHQIKNEAVPHMIYESQANNMNTNSNDTNAQVESIINNIKSSLIASQNQSHSNFVTVNNQISSNSGKMTDESTNNNTNNKNINVASNSDGSTANTITTNTNSATSTMASNDMDLNCYALDSSSLFNLNLNNIEWVA